MAVTSLNSYSYHVIEPMVSLVVMTMFDGTRTLEAATERKGLTNGNLSIFLVIDSSIWKQISLGMEADQYREVAKKVEWSLLFP